MRQGRGLIFVVKEQLIPPNLSKGPSRGRGLSPCQCPCFAFGSGVVGTSHAVLPQHRHSVVVHSSSLLYSILSAPSCQCKCSLRAALCFSKGWWCQGSCCQQPSRTPPSTSGCPSGTSGALPLFYRQTPPNKLSHLIGDALCTPLHKARVLQTPLIGRTPPEEYSRRKNIHPRGLWSRGQLFWFGNAVFNIASVICHPSVRERRNKLVFCNTAWGGKCPGTYRLVFPATDILCKGRCKENN